MRSPGSASSPRCVPPRRQPVSAENDYLGTLDRCIRAAEHGFPHGAWLCVRKRDVLRAPPNSLVLTWSMTCHISRCPYAGTMAFDGRADLRLASTAVR